MVGGEMKLCCGLLETEAAYPARGHKTYNGGGAFLMGLEQTSYNAFTLSLSTIKS